MLRGLRVGLLVTGGSVLPFVLWYNALNLVDELFVELHFYAPWLRWVHLTHSMKQAFDVLRQLRACGLPVHAWP